MSKPKMKTRGAYARTTGQPCQCKALYRGGRCRMHGGLSTGPKTVEGKAKALRVMREGWLRWQQKFADTAIQHEVKNGESLACGA